MLSKYENCMLSLIFLLLYNILLTIFTSKFLCNVQKFEFQLFYCFASYGALFYCLRSIYLQYCVKKEWDNEWFFWYVARPFVGGIFGIMPYLAWKLFFNNFQILNSLIWGMFLMAFIFGMNVDKTLKKIGLYKSNNP